MVFANDNFYTGGFSNTHSNPSANTRSNARNQFANEFPGMEQYAQQHVEYQEDSYMSNEYDEDAELRRVMAQTSMQNNQNPL